MVWREPSDHTSNVGAEDDVCDDGPMDVDYGSGGARLFSQRALHDLIKDINLTKDKAELLGSHLKERNLLEHGVSITTARHRHKELFQYFTMANNLCYCDDAESLMQRLYSDGEQVSRQIWPQHDG